MRRCLYPEQRVAEAHNAFVDEVAEMVDGGEVESLAAHMAPDCRDEFVESLAMLENLGLDFGALITGAVEENGANFDDARISAAEVEMVDDFNAIVRTPLNEESDAYVLVNNKWYGACDE